MSGYRTSGIVAWVIFGISLAVLVLLAGFVGLSIITEPSSDDTEGMLPIVILGAVILGLPALLLVAISGPVAVWCMRRDREQTRAPLGWQEYEAR